MHGDARRIAATGTAVAVLVVGAIELSRISGVASIWLANAFAVGMLVRSRPALRPWLLAAATVALLVGNAVTGTPPVRTVVFTLVNVLEITLALLGFRMAGVHHRFDLGERDFVVGILLAVFVAPTLAATAGAATLAWMGAGGWSQLFAVWWTADALGMIALLPTMWALTPRGARHIVAGPRALEFWLAAALVVATSVLALLWLKHPFVVLALPLLMAAYRVGTAATAVLGLLAICTTLAAAAAARAGVPNASGAGELGFAQLGMYTGLSVLGPLLMSVVVERREAIAAWLRLVTDNLPVLISYLDAEGRYRFANRQYAVWFGYPPEGVLGRTPGQLHGEAYGDHVRPHIAGALAGTMQRFDATLPDGRDTDTSFVPHLRDGQVEGFFVLAHDVSERRAAERALFEERDRSQATLASIADAVVVVDADLCITLLNPVGETMTGWTQETARGRPVHDVVRLVDMDSGEVPLSPLAVAVREDRTVALQVHCALETLDGRRTPIEDTASPIHDATGRVSGAVMVFHDISASHAMALQMSHLAQHDYLTDLPNRVLLHDRLSQALALPAAHGAVLFIDLDHFKHINDSLGHHVGDLVLQEVARRLLGTLRADDTVSRQGGDEFVVLLPRIGDPRDVARVSMAIIAAIEQPIEHEGTQLRLSASIGIALFPQDSSDPRQLLKQADTALYHAKECGRGRHSYFAREMSARAEQRLRLEHELRDALAADGLSLAWQPKVALPHARLVGVEALARWRRDDGATVAPTDFIRLAEDIGLVTMLDEWLMAKACAQAAQWLRAGLEPGVVAVNVSVARLDPARLLRHVDDVLARHGLPPHRLELEFTESHMFRQPQLARVLVESLKARGVRVALDDFGTGHSSLGALADYPFDTLKIDRSFVHGLPGDRKRAAVVQAIVGVADALGCDLVAEGVELVDQAEALAALGCTVMQGYLYARPMDAADMGTWLQPLAPESVGAFKA